ncbi:MAG TPA: LysM peptidoglycan-binding domain-containing protein, partial [Myxococcota bacterium]|nr:LysM peptidoglycan-binding domain-containing protein [Myxococcota bacterium]
MQINVTNSRVGSSAPSPVPTSAPGGALAPIVTPDASAQRESAAVVGSVSTPAAVAAPVASPIREAIPPTVQATYQAQAGDTLASVAKKFGLTEEALTRVNPQLSPDGSLDAGESVNIPSAAGGTAPLAAVGEEDEEGTRSHCGGRGRGRGVAARGESATYTVKAGDTLTEVAKALGIDLRALWNANPSIIHPNQLIAGAVLKLPARAHAQNKNTLVQPGESLADVARRLGVSTGALLRANPQLRNNPRRNGELMLAMGQELAVPRNRGRGNGGCHGRDDEEDNNAVANGGTLRLPVYIPGKPAGTLDAAAPAVATTFQLPTPSPA